MSMRIPTKMRKHEAIVYYQGKRMLQVQNDSSALVGAIQLDLKEAEALMETLAVFIQHVKQT